MSPNLPSPTGLTPLQADSTEFDRSFAAGSFAVGGLFPTPLVIATLIDHEALNADLAATIEKRMATDPGVDVSNVGAWHSNDFASWSGVAGARLIDAVRLLVGRMTLMDGPAGFARAEIAWRITAWANVCRRGDSNRAHGHPGAFWSGIYWVNDGGAGEDEAVGGLLELLDPRGILPLMNAPHLHYAVENCLNAGQLATLTPKTGVVALFPAWLVHAVTRYDGAGRRISIAFNFAPP